jgi:hypothetical protein
MLDKLKKGWEEVKGEILVKWLLKGLENLGRNLNRVNSGGENNPSEFCFL